MGKPVRVAPPQGTWVCEVLVAGRTLRERFTDGGEALRAFHSLGARCARGHLDRVVLWNGGACIDVAVPGGPSARGSHLRLVTEGLDSLTQWPPPPKVAHAPVPAGTAIADLQRVCHCGQVVTEFMERCKGCPGHEGAGKVLRTRRDRCVASAEDLGL